MGTPKIANDLSDNLTLQSLLLQQAVLIQKGRVQCRRDPEPRFFVESRVRIREMLTSRDVFEAVTAKSVDETVAA